MAAETQKTKRERIDNALSNVGSYQRIFKLLCDNKTAFIQKLKRDFRSVKSELFFGKYKMVHTVLGRILSSDQMVSLKGKVEYKKSDKVFLFLLSDQPVEKIKGMLEKVQHTDYERKGDVLSKDIVLPVGELLNEESIKISNTLFKDIQKLGIDNIRINPKTNNIEVTEQIVLGRKGEQMTEEQEKMVKILGIKNKKHGAVVVGFAEIQKE
ncbi:mRNA turnover protein 4 [Nematocida minor]|uniref:mRNA turnover protein 4 n=1 Tax=Nematocida minor TaxID=1912983 RepID=UPI00221F5F46|nr:mRNA turnover protein 4 [Nematocida minor]KAI5192685.1 mRNA turnover protein 4 [Nematocida minor]